MRRLRESASLFAHPVDRGSYVAYFLGAVVPLVALGIVTDRYVLMRAGTLGTGWHPAALEVPEILGLFGAISALSLGCFFMLRRLVKRSLAENHALACYDSLTGLPNRRMYKDRFEQALVRARREGELVANCFVDLDGFKRVNDKLGHSGGDELLRQVAERLASSVRLGDSIARAATDASQAAVSRLGGDEFTFLLTGISDARDAGRVARRVLSKLREPFNVNHLEIPVTASIGIAVFPADGEDVETLLHNADTAMYCAKDLGRNNFQFYSKSMNEATERRLEVERCLRRAIEQDQLSLHYQPVRDAVSGATRGAEALLRWNDPELGPVAPDEFVSVAEDAGLIVPIGAWVLRTACAQAQAWQAAGFRPLRMAVNVSGHQLREPTFVGTVARVLRDSGLSPAHLELEITESTIMQEDEVTDSAFRRLDELGVGLALDDFGTGYSSLSYLRRFPIGRVKIDRSFVSGIPADADDVAIVAAIAAMAHNLLLAVVAEGVETLEQAESLRELGCQELQGYLFSPAVSAEEFEGFLELQKPLASQGRPAPSGG
ncbi:MAG: EAL domain-containing protein [Deltaproteobacteria bacterium]|nr:EAL domain-containing protein [Deltaproteobacteria bacterium]MBW2421018.1 EAL domain-containing protein [Deltaproteobacteria bacterium]